jgi:glycosyltransferase involved in cell wall biosynthesis
MKIGIITGSLNGGAGIASSRLHESFKQLGIESILINKKLHDPVNHIYSSDELLPDNFLVNFVRKIKARHVFKKYILPFVKTDISFALFSTPFSENRLHRLKLLQDCDVINLHWTSGYIDLPSFLDNIEQPIFFTLHDTNYFTAGCHYFNNCNHFEANCDNCPIIESKAQNRLSHIFDIKKGIFNRKRHFVIGISEWIAAAANRSTLMGGLEVKNIPNSFTPVEPTEHPTLKNLKKSNKVKALVIAQHLNDKRKGWAFIEEIIRNNTFPEVTWIVVGEGEILKYENCIELGTIASQNTLASIYGSVDFLVHPAIQDNFPNTVVESLTYGTPVVAFKTSGLPNLINSKNGILAENLETESLSNAITEMIANINHFDRALIKKTALEDFSSNKQGEAYVEFFKQAL